MRVMLTTFSLLLLAGGIACAQGKEGLPPGSRSLSQTVRMLEQRQIRPISVALNGRQWRVEGTDGKESVQLEVDPRTGKILSREKIPDLDPVEGSLPLSRIIRELEKANPGPIIRVRYRKKRWVIETRSGKTTTEIQLSADSGELLMGRDEK